MFTADQLARYQQLQFQFGGFNSLNDPVAQKALSLTDAQVAQLKQDVAWAAQQQAAIQQAARTNQARALELSNAFTTASEQRLNKLLTPAQQQTFAQLAGNRIAFPPIFPAATGTTGTTGTATPGVTTIPGRTGLGGSPLPTPGAIGPTRPTPLTPGAAGADDRRHRDPTGGPDDGRAGPGARSDDRRHAARRRADHGRNGPGRTGKPDAAEEVIATEDEARPRPGRGRASFLTAGGASRTPLVLGST